MTKTILFFRIAIKPKSLFNALKISLIVGTLLNVVNQGETFWNWDMYKVSLWKFSLTYLVPFIVSTYSSTIARIKLKPGARMPLSGEIHCEKCHNNEMHMHENEIIPECKNCENNTKWKLIFSQK